MYHTQVPCFCQRSISYVRTVYWLKQCNIRTYRILLWHTPLSYCETWTILSVFCKKKKLSYILSDNCIFRHPKCFIVSGIWFLQEFLKECTLKLFFSGENIYKQEYFSIVGTRHLKNGGALLEVHYCVWFLSETSIVVVLFSYVISKISCESYFPDSFHQESLAGRSLQQCWIPHT